MKYTVVIERTPAGYSAYAPDLPGCAAAATTAMGIRKLIREAIQFHLEGLREDGIVPPKPSVTIAKIDVGVPSGTRAPRTKKPQVKPKKVANRLRAA